MESQFTLAGATKETTKFHHLVSALQPEELAVVSDIILNQRQMFLSPPLRKDCAQYADSEAQLLRDLITGMQLGYQRPSRLLLEMRGKQILAISNYNLDKLAEMADGIMPTSSAPVINAVATSADQPDLRTMLCEITSRLSRLSVHETSQEVVIKDVLQADPDKLRILSTAFTTGSSNNKQQNVDPHVLTRRKTSSSVIQKKGGRRGDDSVSILD
ncbi:uncharacterized protein CDAR_528471 [Caerostris darwini]|uniref:DUF7041 domain-containing protein n=1 Tax=Caerostris darwini TaxID=1538125 RepID=A0AAV4P510_9ARAC|nr:uncharacterized protein CDAR_528471 [Caerostris darwini]